MKQSLQILLVLAAVIYLFSPQANAYESYPAYIVAHNIQARQINGEFRFCERENLKNGVCYQTVEFFGKKKRVPQDWWTPESYITAYTDYQAPTVVSLQPTPDGRGVVIYYQ